MPLSSPQCKASSFSVTKNQQSYFFHLCSCASVFPPVQSFHLFQWLAKIRSFISSIYVPVPLSSPQCKASSFSVVSKNQQFYFFHLCSCASSPSANLFPQCKSCTAEGQSANIHQRENVTSITVTVSALALLWFGFASYRPEPGTGDSFIHLCVKQLPKYINLHEIFIQLLISKLNGHSTVNQQFE